MQGVVAMNMIKKCAKFHKDSSGDKKVKAGPPPPFDLSFGHFWLFCFMV